MKKFGLYHKETFLGQIIFDSGNYQFILDADISIEDCNNRYGILPLDENKQLKSNDLFEQLNIRLPIRLRKSENNDKLDFIEKNYLKVISDNYELRPI